MCIFSLPGLLRILLCADFRSLVVGFSRRVLSLRGFRFSVVFGSPAVFGSLRGFSVLFVVFGSPVSPVLSVGVLSVCFCSAVSVFVGFVCVRSVCGGLFVVVFCGFVLLPCWPSVACCFCVGFCCFVWASGASCELPLLGVGFYCLVWCGLLLHRVGFFCFVFWFLLLCMGLLVFLNATNIESRARVPFEGHQKAHGKGTVDTHQLK